MAVVTGRWNIFFVLFPFAALATVAKAEFPHDFKNDKDLGGTIVSELEAGQLDTLENQYRDFQFKAGLGSCSACSLGVSFGGVKMRLYYRASVTYRLLEPPSEDWMVSCRKKKP